MLPLFIPQQALNLEKAADDQLILPKDWLLMVIELRQLTLESKAMGHIDRIRFFATPQHQCSYLPKQRATTLFVDPNFPISLDTYSVLSENGFRRSGNYLYQPQCEGCQACIPVRIPVAFFQPSRSQKRIYKKNATLEVVSQRALYNDEFYALYARYITVRHKDGDMYPPSRHQYESFLMSRWGNTEFLVLREHGQLLAVAVIDVLHNALSAIYTFFDPSQAERSLGVYSILRQVEEAKRRGLGYVYLGYWIKECRKMSYKLKYRPTECFYRNHWTLLT